MVGCERIWSEKNIDFEKIFSFVIKMSSIQIVLSLAASINLEIEQLDMKTTFLYRDLEKKNYKE